MNVEYRRDLAHSYMLFDSCGETAEDSYQMKTLLANRIDGLLPLSIWHVDDKNGYRYDITGLQSFAAYCESVSIEPAKLRHIYAGLLDSMRESMKVFL